MLKLDVINKMKEAYKEKHNSKGMFLPHVSYYTQIVKYVECKYILMALDEFIQSWDKLDFPPINYYFIKAQKYKKKERS